MNRQEWYKLYTERCSEVIDTQHPIPLTLHQGDLTCHLHYCNQGFFQDFDQGGLKCDVMGYWGGKLYYLPK